MNFSDLVSKVLYYPARVLDARAYDFTLLIDALYILPVPALAAVCYVNSRGYLHRRAERGSLSALLRLTRPFILKDPASRNESGPLLHSARSGVAATMYGIGKMMLSGEQTCFRPDKGVGRLWVMLSASYGHADAIRALGGHGGHQQAGGSPPGPRAAPGEEPVDVDSPGDEAPSSGINTGASLHPATAADPFRELYSLVGLEAIKKTVSDIADRAQLFRLRREKGLGNTQPALHLVFMGNPGTGKTVVARILGGILKQAGYLAKGHVVEVAVPEMISQWVGETPQKVKENVMKALDGVLFIDEAYALIGYSTAGGNNYGAQAIATLLKLMEDYKDRLVVIAAGYPAEMQGFLEANPGFRSRFTDVILFEDYSAEDLVTIFHKLARDAQFKVDAGAASALVETMREAKTVFVRNFSNGRFARNLFEHAVKNLASRISQQGQHSRQDIEVLTADDIRKALAELRKDAAPAAGTAGAAGGQDGGGYHTGGTAAALPEPPIFQKSDLAEQTPSAPKAPGPVVSPVHPVLGELETKVDPVAELDSLVGLGPIKKAVADIGDRLRHFEQRRQQGLSAARPVVHMALLGNPGTGKTTVARLIGRILKRSGYLAGGQLVEVQVPDLVGPDAGATARKVRDIVQQALGGVLLVDGARRLAPAGGADESREALSLLFKLMEDEKDRLVVILAGYPPEMRQLLDSDPGFRSRITDLVVFDDYGPEELARIYLKFAGDQQYKLEPAAQTLLAALVKKAAADMRPFSNGRFIRNVFEDSIRNLAGRTDHLPAVSREDVETIRAADLELAFAEAQKQEQGVS